MKKAAGIIIDNSDGREDIFDRFASEIEQSKQNRERDYGLNEIMDKIHTVETLLQDLSEKINVTNERESLAYTLVINKTGELLRKWMVLFLNRNKNPNIVFLLNFDLDFLIENVAIENIYGKSLSDLERGFSSSFLIQKIDFNGIAKELGRSTLAQISNDEPDLSEQLISSLVGKLKATAFSASYIGGRAVMQTRHAESRMAYRARRYAGAQEEFVADGENVEYLWLVSIWIDTTDAGIANEFMYLVSSTLCYIDDVKINIVSAKVGSLMQNWIVKFKGFFAKESVVQILKSVLRILDEMARAAKAYGLDRHIEPVETSKAQRQKIEEENRRQMTEDQAKLMNELKLEEKREDVEAKRLANMEKKLEIRKKLSEMMADHLAEIDVDYDIMVNNRPLIKKKNGQITTGNISDINNSTRRSEIDPPGDSNPEV